MSRASTEALDGLHAAVAQVLKEQLNGDDVSPQLISQAIKFLKDNGIDAPAKSARISDLAASLDDLDFEELGSQPH